MALDDHTAREQLTPEQRRSMLRALADRMLLKIAAMDDPEDMPGVERAMRVGAVIERIYSRCDRAERSIPDPHKCEAERARNADEAIKARVQLANTFDWGEQRRKALGETWDAAGEVIKPGVATPRAHKPAPTPAKTPAKTQNPAPAIAPAPLPGVVTPGLPTPALSITPVEVADYTDIIEKALASGLRLRRQNNTAAGPEPPSSV